VSGVLRTNQGKPLEGVRVAVTPADGTDPGESGSVLEVLAQTDREGRYLVQNIRPGRYHLATGQLGSLSYLPSITQINRAATIVVNAGATTEVHDMVFSRSSVSGRVIDSVTGMGRRIASLSLCCERSANTVLSFIDVDANTITASVHDDGSFEFMAVAPG